MTTPSKPGRVILTYGRSLMALVIARSLAERGVEVIACDDVELTVCAFSRHVKETFRVAPWDSEPEQYLQDLEAAVLEYAPNDGRPYVLMPTFREIDLIARNRKRFEPAIKLAAPAIKSINLVTPKHCLAQLAREYDLDIPETWPVLTDRIQQGRFRSSCSPARPLDPRSESRSRPGDYRGRPAV
jgi:predicted ATP-grasp superfamily ATP-dependent carboligase